MSQTCRLLYTILNPQLYSRFANSCDPNILRLVKTGNSDALRMLLSAGYKLFDFMDTPQLWWREGDTFVDNKTCSSPMIIAATQGHLGILQMLIDNLPSIITKSAFRSWHLLCRAAMCGHLDIVKFLIAQGVPVNYIDKVGTTLMQSATRGGHLPVFQYIIEETTCKDQLHAVAADLLYRATNAGHLEIVKYLVKCGADFTYPSCKHSPTSAFDSAITWGYEDIISFFLDNVPPKLLDNMIISGWNSMLRPCYRDNPNPFRRSPWEKPRLAQAILDRVDLETKLAAITPLEQAYLLAVAAETGNMPLTQRLLDSSRGPVLPRISYTPVCCSVNNGHAEITEAFLRFPNYPVSQIDVFTAAKKGETAVVLRLLHKVENKDFKRFAAVALNTACHSDQFIAVMENTLGALSKYDVETLISLATSSADLQASRAGRLEVTKFLLEKGGIQPFDEINKQLDYLGRHSAKPISFLEHAAAVCPVDQFRAALAQWNFELDPYNDYCKAALAASALHKNAETLQVFIERGFDVNSTHLHGQTISPLLHLVVETLDENGRVVDRNDERAQVQIDRIDGHTWLGHINPHSSIQLLIEHGARINQADSDGRTALFLATERMTLALAEELLRLGANPLIKGLGRGSALQLAISQAQIKYVKAFLKAMQARSFTCDNFLALVPETLPIGMLPNRASGERFSVPAGHPLSQHRMLARDGHMGPTKTFPSPWGDGDRRGSTSSEYPPKHR
ncbi:uncharacterized protein N7500_006184 [Penicillium coprophilum]|uniref:uncharacterized protein n=1 Tax=Penicillium coprophilum TaxID=36646 RepID=UPI0023834788|nr:uncharacterized protein N7500_006184 [Penicillium coprophilum]KAJ5164354.1 hypothetical protein N7500_006184 [Penicillium coprophilum]